MQVIEMKSHPLVVANEVKCIFHDDKCLAIPIKVNEYFARLGDQVIVPLRAYVIDDALSLHLLHCLTLFVLGPLVNIGLSFVHRLLFVLVLVLLALLFFLL